MLDDVDITVPVRQRPAIKDREVLVLQLLALGYSRQRVAVLTNTPEAEVARQERSACAALGASDLGEAVAKARWRGLVL